MSDTQPSYSLSPEAALLTPTPEPISRHRFDEIDEELLISLLRPNKDRLNCKFRDPVPK